MKVIRGVSVAALLGAGFGSITSLVNDVSSPYGELGSRLVGAGWTWITEVAEVGSMLLDVGWAWAAVALVAGWLAGGTLRAAAAGAVSLLAATAAYYVTDSLLRGEPLAGYAGETRYWWVASLMLGPLLGVVGATIARTGAVGLLAGLVVPVGALVQTFFLQPGLASSSPAAMWALVIVSTAAVATISLAVARFVRRPEPKTEELLPEASSG